ncbi:helix-turn-helix domain-containing protein [Streptomyces sp. NPDC050636]|uniref:helix-turn-helix domain-containing protein n=1 Tax=Streptomyces sp. NPDC050636 TaxID=3154510 RepID=UPI003420F7CA
MHPAAPSGRPVHLAKLAERAGVSKRTLASAESSDGTNLTIGTLVKVAHSLGIQRWAYFLDERVFGEVNSELETLKELRRGKVETVALRTSSPGGLPPASLAELTSLITGIVASAQVACDTLHELPVGDGSTRQ